MARTVGLILAENKAEEQKTAHVCPHCGKEFKSAETLKTHVTKTHPQVFNEERPHG